MMSQTAGKKPWRTAMMPVTTLEEVPILDDEERAEMLASLKEAEARIAAGEYVEYDPATFKDHLLAIYKAARNAKTA
jgi:hypothetical protein